MADKLVSIMVDPRNFGHSGKCFNVYDTYANAIAHGATGLKTIKDFDRLLGTATTTISQVAKQVGVTPDQVGRLTFIVDDGAAIHLVTEGYGVPIRVPTGQLV